jgi:Na+/melibiose symporter-like transporter
MQTRANFTYDVAAFLPSTSFLPSMLAQKQQELKRTTSWRHCLSLQKEHLLFLLYLLFLPKNKTKQQLHNHHTTSKSINLSTKDTQNTSINQAITQHV